MDPRQTWRRTRRRPRPARKGVATPRGAQTTPPKLRPGRAWTTRTDESADAATRWSPSGDQRTAVTTPPNPTTATTDSVGVMSQTRTDLSSEPEASSVPSGPTTCDECPSSFQKSLESSVAAAGRGLRARREAADAVGVVRHGPRQARALVAARVVDLPQRQLRRRAADGERVVPHPAQRQDVKGLAVAVVVVVRAVGLGVGRAAQQGAAAVGVRRRVVAALLELRRRPEPELVEQVAVGTPHGDAAVRAARREHGAVGAEAHGPHPAALVVVLLVVVAIEEQAHGLARVPPEAHGAVAAARRDEPRRRAPRQARDAADVRPAVEHGPRQLAELVVLVLVLVLLAQGLDGRELHRGPLRARALHALVPLAAVGRRAVAPRRHRATGRRGVSLLTFSGWGCPYCALAPAQVARKPNTVQLSL